jgi:hypothetical protein
MANPVRIQWVDTLPSLPDAGLLRHPILVVPAGQETNVPDGAVEAFFETGCTVVWNDYSGVPAGAPLQQVVAAGDTIRCQGQTFTLAVAGSDVRFFLAGL